jgi:hypothetical protein
LITECEEYYPELLEGWHPDKWHTEPPRPLPDPLQ